MNVQKEVASLKEEIKGRAKRIKWLLKHAITLADLPDGSMCGSQLDFDKLPHKDVIKVIRAMGGKWKKDKSCGGENKIDYVAEVDGVRVRCWAGDPPPSCKLVEVEEHVPERVVPAHTVKRLKMVCHPSVEASITLGQEKAAALAAQEAQVSP